MTSPTASQPAKKHVKQNSRIVPVIPKHFSRQKDPGQKKGDSTVTLNKDSSSVSSETETSSIHKSDIPRTSEQSNGNGNGEAHWPISPISDHVISQASAGAEDSAPLTNELLVDNIGVNGRSSPDPTTLHSAAGSEQGHEGDRHTAAGSASDTKQNVALGKISTATKSPVELPPPFYPASHGPGNSHLADLRANRRSFVFGGNVDSSAPSPVPPPSAGSWNSSSAGLPPTDGMTSPNPPQMNGFGRPESYLTGARQSTTYNPASAPPFQPHHNPQHSQSMQPAVNGHHGAHHRPWQGSQHIQSPRSPSVASNPSEPPFPPQYPAYPSGPLYPFYNGYSGEGIANMPRHMQYTSFAPPLHSNRGSGHFDYRPQSQSNLDYDLYNGQALSAHVEATLDNAEFADCILRIESERGVYTENLGHCLVLARSPRLRRRLLEPARAEPRKYQGRECRLIDIPSDAIFQDSNMFTLALRYLYGGSLIRRDHLQSSLGSPRQAMASVLSYIVAGWYLEVPEIATAGIALAADFLLPENLEVALDFALKQDTIASTENGATTNGHMILPVHTPKYQPYSAELLHIIQRFMTFPLTTGFDFDASAPELDTIPRIPVELRPRSSFAHASRASVSNPKLQGITLGSFQAHSSGNHVLSSVLLSLPSFVVQSLFAERAFRERMPPDAAQGLVKAVVTERETRRLKAIAGRNTAIGGEDHGTGEENIPALATEEQVESLPPDQGSFRIVLRHVSRTST
ncbi:hypothetical protein ANO11243_095500 [Dothideomycetidae sp. 11243]|nr:hypothetical protein ANO11243_095500 [fungal sp. No.11243]